MREDNFPHRVSDPEAEGLPGPSDDDSTVYDDVDGGREADGPSPAALPADVPLAVDRYGTTPEEQRHGESLDAKLDREVPDLAAPAPDRPAADGGDTEDTGLGTPGFSAVGEAATTDPATDSAVSVYDRPEWDTTGRPVGRIVEPDEGFGTDDETDMIAYDAGAAGGGANAEESAMHEVPD